MVVLRYDHKFMQIIIDKINNHLKREMKITDEKKLREILRRVSNYIYVDDSGGEPFCGR